MHRDGVSTPAYLGPVTSTYTVRNTERYPFSILPFGVTAMRVAVGRLQTGASWNQLFQIPGYRTGTSSRPR